MLTKSMKIGYHMSEMIMKTCRACNKDKPASKVGRISESGFEYYAGEDGRLWLGRLCPDCAKEDRKKYMKPKGYFPKKKCSHCSTEFQPERRNALFCSKECGISFHSLERTRKKHKTEEKTEIPVPPVQLSKSGKKRKEEMEELNRLREFKAHMDKVMETHKDVFAKLAEYDVNVDKDGKNLQDGEEK